MTTHIMLDLETLGRRPGCVVLQIGACVFDHYGPTGQTFDAPVNIAASLQLGLAEDPETVRWWAEQGDDAKALLDLCTSTASLPPTIAADGFNRFVLEVSSGCDVMLWGNGAVFDNAILHGMFDACGIKPVWPFWSDVCYRTFKAMHRNVPKVHFVGTPHNALHDAINQARHCAAILRSLNG